MFSFSLLPSIVATGFTVAFVHAAMPTHWLPFVLAGRAQKWSGTKVLIITALAGAGHVLFTALLGFIVVWFGMEASRHFVGKLPLVSSAVLIVLGLFYFYRYGRGHVHSHWGHSASCDHDHSSEDLEENPNLANIALRSDRAVILSLLAVLTFSPCEGFLPIYLSAANYGWPGFMLMSAILSLSTLAGMMSFTTLALAGMQRVKLGALERYENLVLGGLLILLAFAILVIEG